MYVDDHDPGDCHGMLDGFAEQYCSVGIQELHVMASWFLQVSLPSDPPDNSMLVCSYLVVQ